MKIALIGYGKMGKMVEQAALSQGHEIAAIIKHSSKYDLNGADICIDFSQPKCALDNLRKIAPLGINVVMGTTGWYENIEEAKHIVNDAGIGFLYGPNFSLGIAIFLKLITEASKLIKPTQYDVSGVEIHHRTKIDRPSGTAQAISNILRHLKKDVEFASVRVGSVPGTHSVIFDSPADTITLTHEARSREAFALGALQAAEWLKDKKGFFHFDEFVKRILHE